MSAASEERMTPPAAPARPFFPDLFVVEALVAVAMLAVLIVLAALTSAPLEEAASRDAAGYVPRPEWYFLWFFQLLKYFKGSLEAVGTVLVPLLVIGLLVAVPFIDRREPRTRSIGGRTRPIRVLPCVIAVVVVALLLALTIVAVVDRAPSPPDLPPAEWPPQSQVHDSGGPTSHAPESDGNTRRSHARVA